MGEVVQINEHEGSLRKADPGVRAGMQKKLDYASKKMIDDVLGTEGFVEINMEDFK